jgi:hypothetical protein
MEIKLDRYSRSQNATLGTLDTMLGDDPSTAWRCYTLEDKDRELELHPEAKVKNETCIPRGRYQVVITPSNRFKKDLPLLIDVPGFSGVRIHTGNKPEDTEGCIIVGTRPTGPEWIPNSKVTFNELFQRIRSALDSGEKVWINIT